MKTAIAIRHVHFEDLGHIQPMLQRNGYKAHILDAGIDTLDATQLMDVDLLIVLGAPIGAYDEQTYPFLQHELQALHQRLSAQRPTLGICLGAQLMARVLGAKVAPMPRKEIGYAPLHDIEPENLLAPLNAIPVLHWHGDQFDIPNQATRLAASALCPNQAFAVGNYALGLQFHLEADASQIERWLIGHATELHQAGIDPRQIRADAQTHGERLRTAAEQVIENWLHGLPKH